MAIERVTGLGNINISQEAIATLAGGVVSECYGVVGMAYRSKSDSVASLLKKDNYTKGIKVDITDDNKINVDIHIIIEYGINISVIGNSIIKNVKYQLTHMTGLEVEQVNVCVEGFRVQEQE